MGGTKDSVGCKTINLALQGGGSHGAFAWGALDRILEDERIVVDGPSPEPINQSNIFIGADAKALCCTLPARSDTLGLGILWCT